MPYKYDVFVSVKWDETFAAWMREHFLPPFTTYLRNADSFRETPAGETRVEVKAGSTHDAVLEITAPPTTRELLESSR